MPVSTPRLTGDGEGDCLHFILGCKSSFYFVIIKKTPKNVITITKRNLMPEPGVFI